MLKLVMVMVMLGMVGMTVVMVMVIVGMMMMVMVTVTVTVMAAHLAYLVEGFLSKATFLRGSTDTEVWNSVFPLGGRGDLKFPFMFF